MAAIWNRGPDMRHTRTLKDFYQGLTVLITGAAGTIGQELVRQVHACNPGEIRLVDNNESALFFLGKEYQHSPQVIPYLADVRDEQTLLNLTRGVDLIFHTAAFKHVSLSEYCPFEAVQTNINGVRNIMQAALFNRVPRVIFTSSDKAVNPTNVMGTSKLMGERLVTAANLMNSNGKQIFSSVRFGNVLGSRGSVLPIFAEQIRLGQPVTVTDRRMTRFVMTVQEAVRLVMVAARIACGGEVFVTKMPVMRIVDLARAMIDLLAADFGHDPRSIPIDFIGGMPGEKLYEELISAEEVDRLVELPEIFAILPAFRNFYRNVDYRYEDALPESEVQRRAYVSSADNAMTVPEIKAYLKRWGVLAQAVLQTAPSHPMLARDLAPGEPERFGRLGKLG